MKAQSFMIEKLWHKNYFGTDRGTDGPKTRCRAIPFRWHKNKVNSFIPNQQFQLNMLHYTNSQL